jgi:hypothetical protein
MARIIVALRRVSVPYARYKQHPHPEHSMTHPQTAFPRDRRELPAAERALARRYLGIAFLSGIAIAALTIWLFGL